MLDSVFCHRPKDNVLIDTDDSCEAKKNLIALYKIHSQSYNIFRQKLDMSTKNLYKFKTYISSINIKYKEERKPAKSLAILNPPELPLHIDLNTIFVKSLLTVDLTLGWIESDTDNLYRLQDWIIILDKSVVLFLIQNFQ